MMRLTWRKKCCLFVLPVILGLLSACSSPLAETPAEDEFLLAQKNYQEKFLPAKELPLAEITNLPDACEIYSQQVVRYYLPLAEGWTQEACSEYGLSDMLYACVGAKSLQGLGFACVDLNGDGVDELLIGSTDAHDPMILELWAIVNEKPKLIAQAEDGSRYYLRCNENTGEYIWENCTGPAENETACFYFTFNGIHLEYLWDIFPGIDSARQDTLQEAAAEMGGKRILPPCTPYVALKYA